MSVCVVGGWVGGRKLMKGTKGTREREAHRRTITSQFVHSAFYVQHSAHITQHTPYTPYTMQHTVYIIQHKTHSIPHIACSRRTPPIARTPPIHRITNIGLCMILPPSSFFHRAYSTYPPYPPYPHLKAPRVVRCVDRTRDQRLHHIGEEEGGRHRMYVVV